MVIRIVTISGLLLATVPATAQIEARDGNDSVRIDESGVRARSGDGGRASISGNGGSARDRRAEQASGEGLSITGSGRNATMNCRGGAASVTGSGNTIRFTGACRAVEISGSGNRITADMARGGAIDVNGSANEVRYTSPVTPRIERSGVGNNVTRLRGG